MSTPSTPWQSGTHAALVPLSTHSLYLSASGPNRPLTSTGNLQPAIIIEAGLCSGHSEWVAASRLISQRARVYSYDRVGYGRSEPSPHEYTAENGVREWVSDSPNLAGLSFLGHFQLSLFAVA
ncbi:hypothetical protein BO94DRAFT_609145 [Aspergillus sclerotioniger CBS 115572]|uniref:AB hydrolase-1 domain-containing protein n=1 Tax=Aspergillus sclerotioniger CBS 115572 TaxID=1450535 RepID=A0A317VG76_9EURO|nr:hypothetical protein BO94DRAFT_609145 [Aspergillus sclerotioniger CBS 115572]PWY70850.1 hypothetical protein BO94DRAFT_609145 [Aspergillus sclerotioniger CBS 115572]